MKLFIKHNFTNHAYGLTTTRLKGESVVPYDCFNLAYQVGDDQNKVKLNREALLSALKLGPDSLVLTQQSHSTKISRVSKEDGGKGKDCFETGVKADGLYTTETNLTLGIFHADCVPVMFYEANKGVIGIIHASMINTVQHFTKTALQQVVQDTGIDIAKLQVYLGPHLTFSHNEINQKQKTELLSLGFSKCLKETNGRIFFDTYLANYLDLIAIGVKQDHIVISKMCTFENNQTFFSVKASPITGRMISLVLNRP